MIELENVFKRPLIMGASISADWATISPGKRLALRYTTPDQIKTEAYGGRPGKDILGLMPADSLKDRTAVVAIDLFFWDSTLPDSKISLQAFRNLMEQVKKQNIPIVLGEVPELIPGYQPRAAEINKVLKQACLDYDKCYLMPFIKLHQQIKREHSLTISGRRYSFKELVPDGLHIGDKVGDYLAEMMQDLLLGKK